jgi:HK97 gp10 family phage protein
MSITIHIIADTGPLESIAAGAPALDGLIAELGSEAIAAAAADLVPVRTGFLRSSITRQVSGGSFVVSALAPYAGFIEWGTRHMAAQPYMTPAAESVDWLALAGAALRLIGL